jgi:hypothetical protein
MMHLHEVRVLKADVLVCLDNAAVTEVPGVLG